MSSTPLALMPRVPRMDRPAREREPTGATLRRPEAESRSGLPAEKGEQLGDPEPPEPPGLDLAEGGEELHHRLLLASAGDGSLDTA